MQIYSDRLCLASILTLWYSTSRLYQLVPICNLFGYYMNEAFFYQTSGVNNLIHFASPFFSVFFTIIIIEFTVTVWMNWCFVVLKHQDLLDAQMNTNQQGTLFMTSYHYDIMQKMLHGKPF